MNRKSGIDLPGGLLPYASGLGLAVLVAYIMIVGRDLLVPFMVSVTLWYLINLLAAYYHKISVGPVRIPHSISFIGALITILIIVSLLVRMVGRNITEVKASLPLYQENFARLFAQLFEFLPFAPSSDFTDIIQQLDLSRLMADLAGTVASLVGNTGLILIYLLFLMLEQKYFKDKREKLLAYTPHKETVLAIFDHIAADVRVYVGVKVFVSALTGGACYLVLWIVGVNNASFWAFLIFLLNFIPTIGSMLAVLFPSLLSLVQFDSFTPFVIITLSLMSIQMILGNILEPKLMGSRLNLSPLAVMLSLSLWGSMWGIVGMFLSVPFTVILMIVFSQFEKTAPIAIFLSQDGNIRPRRAA